MQHLTLHPAGLTRAQFEAGQSALCALPYALAPSVSQKINGDWSLDFAYPIGKPGADQLALNMLVLADGQLYRIEEITRHSGREGDRLEVNALHLVYDLRNRMITNIETAETTPGGINQRTALQQVLNGSDFTDGVIDTDIVLDYLDILQKDALWAIKEQVLALWGGELQPDNWTIHIRKQMGADRGVHLRYGKNIKGVKYSETMDGVITRLHILGYRGANIESINGGKDYIDSPHVHLYAGVREGLVTFADDDLPGDLMRKGVAYLGTVDSPRIKLSVDLAAVMTSEQYRHYKDLERVGLGDTVVLYHRRLGIHINARVQSREYNPVTGENHKVELGNDNRNLYTSIASMHQAAELIKMIVDRNGHLRGENIRGVIDLLTTQLMASGSYSNAQVVKGKGALFENTDESSPDYGAMYIGPGIFAIANSKTQDGSWDWRTFGTGQGFVGSEMVAGSVKAEQIDVDNLMGSTAMIGAIKSPHIESEAIHTNHLNPGVMQSVMENATGQQLVVTFSNGTVLDYENTVTIATLRMYHQGVDITHRIPEPAIRWERISDDPLDDQVWNLDPLHQGRSIEIKASDINFRGVLRCHIQEMRLYAVPQYRDGKLFMVDFGSGDALNFRNVDGMLYYDGPNEYIVRDGALYTDMLIGEFVYDTTLTNLRTAYHSISRYGHDIYAGGHIKAKAGANMEFEAGADMTLKAGAAFDLVAGSNNDYMRLTNKDPELRGIFGGPTKETAPLWWDKYGNIKATQLQLNNSNITDFTAPLQYSDADNADPNNPMIFDVFMPAEYLGIQSLKLSFKRQPFRAYSTGAGSGGGSAVTSRAGGASATTSRSGGGQTSNQVAQVTIGGNSVRSGGASGETVAHTHVTLLPDWYVPAHAHGMPTHTHVVDIPEHTHILDIPAHTHGIIYGIYQGPTATSCNVYVDGNFVGAFPSMSAYNVVAWLTKSAGKITRDSWHNISIYPNALCRIVAQAFGLALIGRAENTIY